MWLPEIISWELISMGLPESLAGGDVNCRRTIITGNIGNNAITGNYSRRINLERSLEKSVKSELCDYQKKCLTN